MQGYAAVQGKVGEVEVWGLGGSDADEQQAKFQHRENLFAEQRRKASIFFLDIFFLGNICALIDGKDLYHHCGSRCWYLACSQTFYCNDPAYKRQNSLLHLLLQKIVFTSLVISANVSII